MTYQWNVGGIPVQDAMQPTYTVSAYDRGAVVTVSVTGSHPGLPDRTVTSDPILISSTPTFEWVDTALPTSTVRQGAARGGEVRFRTNITKGLELAVTGDLSGLITLDPNSATLSGDEFTISYSVEAGSIAGTRTGTIVANENGEQVGSPLSYSIAVETLNDTDIPTGTSQPSSTRIGTSAGMDVVLDRITVKVSDDAEDPRAEIRRLAGQQSALLEGSVPGARIFDLRVDAARIESVMAELRSDPSVELATRAWLGSSDFVPNDPIWSSTNGDKRWNLEMIDAPAAWDTSTGAGVRVGLIDTGFALDHADLEGHVRAHSGVGNSPAHGTHTAGTACAAGDNGVGLTGVAYGCELVLRSIMDEETSISQMVEAMRWSAREDARVVNISYGWATAFDCTSRFLDDEKAAIYRELRDMSAMLGKEVSRLGDVLWVFSAGNETLDAACSATARLATRDNVVSVAAVEKSGDLATYSNFGQYVTLAAPGGSLDGLGGPMVYSAAPRKCFLFDGFLCSAEYAEMAGTSMAAPHVAGTAALAFGVTPGATPAQVKECLVSGAAAGGRAVPGHSFDVINAAETVQCAQDLAPPVLDTSTMRRWGRGPAGVSWDLAPTPIAAPTFAKVLTESTAAVAVDDNGRVWTWGSNQSYGLGNQSTTTAVVDSPVRLDGPRGVVDIQMTNWTKYALDDAGHVYSWGTDANGTLGTGAYNGAAWRPTRINGLEDVVQLRGGTSTTFALTGSGQVYAWGWGYDGAAGPGAPQAVTTPRLVTGLPRLTSIFSARGAGFGVDTSGRLWSWGNYRVVGRYGGSSPGMVSGVTGKVVDLVSTSGRTTLSDVFVLLADGTVWGWGDGTYGLLGTGNGTASPLPVQISGLSNIKQLAVGWSTGYAIDADGTTRAWGFGYNGELGDGSDTHWTGTPQVVPGLPTARRVFSNGGTQFVLDTEGGVWAWGDGGYGGLGNGTQDSARGPAQVPGLLDVSRLFINFGADAIVMAAQGGQTG